MKPRIPSGKQILLPGLVLAVAAMGLLSFLQIRWMGDSLQAENMRYRRGVNDDLNHIVWKLFERLDLDRLDPESLEASMKGWKEDSEYPDLIKSASPLGNDRAQAGEFSPHEGDVYILGGRADAGYLLVLDGASLYETLLMEELREYSLDYSFTVSYEEMAPDFREKAGPMEDRDSLIRTYLPQFIDLSDAERRFDNILFSPREMPFPPERAEGGGGKIIHAYRLTVDLNEGRGTARFERRLKRSNLGLLGSLILILAGCYYLLFRLYRDEEGLRRTEQTFVASVSHELRTPIAVIKTASENLQRGIVADGERVKAYGQVIQTEADRLNRMVEGILSYSRMEGSGANNSRPVKTDPRSCTGEILERLKLTYPECRWDEDLTGAPAEVLLDRESYRLILENLVTNGILHGEKGIMRIRLLSDFPSRWRLIVEDEGGGIPRREQKRIFDPFVRGRKSEERQVRGSGLGLYLVKRAALSMGGSVILESPYEYPAGRERGGCRFTLILPVGEEQ